MGKEGLQKATYNSSDSDLRHRSLAVLGIALLFLVGAALLIGGLWRLIPWLLLGIALLAPPAMLVRLWFNRVQLRPLSQALRVSPETRLGRPEQQQALAALDLFPLRSALLSTGLWLVTAGLLLFFVHLIAGITLFQGLMVSGLAAAGMTIDLVISPQAYGRQLATLRQRLEALAEAPQSTREIRGPLAQRLTLVISVVLLLGIGLSALCWYSRARALVADRLLSEKEAALVASAGALGALLASNPDIDLTDAIRQADPSARLRRDLLLLDEQGRQRWPAVAERVNQEWLARIAAAQPTDWRHLEAPFLYLARPVGRDRFLLWVGDISQVSSAMQAMPWFGLASVGWAVLLGLILSASLFRAGLRPLEQMSERLQSVVRGEREHIGVVDAHGEVGQLLAAVEGFGSAVRTVLAEGEQTCQGVLGDQKRLKELLVRLHESAEMRSGKAEGTATSVIEMRSSIESLSEQIESLREASSDCSSSLFEIDQSVREVAASAENLQHLVDDTASAMSQISASFGSVVENVDALANRAEETVGAVGVMESAMRQVEDRTSATQRLSVEVSDIAARGAESVRETITGIHEIQEVTHESREVINRLGSQMEAVGKILTVIGDVAEKTNLLALNAAIIAAAAGEHGKGFAVVADEIKDLADRTSTSTKEIASLIKSVQAESRRAVDAIERGAGSVRRGVQLANNAGEALTQILGSVRQVNQMADEISRSTTEHAEISGAITRSMTDISAMVREVRRSVSEQTQGSQRVNRVSEQMRDDARFVYRSANEQVQAIHGVTQNMERISEMVGFISRAVAEQSQGVSHVARSAEEVRDSLQTEIASIADLDEVATSLGKQARHFFQTMESLTPGGGER